MADSETGGMIVIPAEKYEELRRKVTVPDSKNKTDKWLTGQLHERKSRLSAYLSQMANLEGLIEVAEDEIKELEIRLVTLETIK